VFIAQEYIEIRAIFWFLNIAAGLEKRGQKTAWGQNFGQ